MRLKHDAQLKARIQAIHSWSRGTYGAPRIHAELTDESVHVGRKRIARLLRELGLAAVSRRKGTRTTRRDRDARLAPDLVERQFAAERPDQLWVADVTYVPTWAGFVYLAVVVDAFSRRVVGWSMATHLRTELVLEALNMALWQRRPESVIHHSDQGCQGEFKRSSQHLNEEDMRWPYVDNRREGVLFDHQCARPAERRYLVVRIDTDSGVRSHKAFRAKMLARLPVCRRQLVAGGSEKEAECPRFSSRRSRGATCRLPNARKLRSYTRKSLVSAPLPESLDELHPRSLVNYGEMLRPDPVVSITVRRRHSGTQTDVHDDRRLRSSPRTRRYVPGYRNASRAASVRRMVFR